MARPAQAEREIPRPNIFEHHDYREFLKVWFEYLKKTQPRFSLRRLAEESKLSCAYLPKILAGTRNITQKGLDKFSRLLALTPSERSYLELLCTVSDSDSQEARLEALEKLQRFRAYQELNSKEIEVYKYLTHWFYVAIREMAALSDFRPDPNWIRGRLKSKPSLSAIKEALDFLIQNGYVKMDEKGKARRPDKNLNCEGEVYRIAIRQFHREMLQLATDSLGNTPTDKRTVTGHAMPISSESYPKLQKILDKALRQIEELGQTETSARGVYYVTLAAFPLTEERPTGTDDE